MDDPYRLRGWCAWAAAPRDLLCMCRRRSGLESAAPPRKAAMVGPGREGTVTGRAVTSWLSISLAVAAQNQPDGAQDDLDVETQIPVA